MPGFLPPPRRFDHCHILKQVNRFARQQAYDLQQRRVLRDRSKSRMVLNETTEFSDIFGTQICRYAGQFTPSLTESKFFAFRDCLWFLHGFLRG